MKLIRHGEKGLPGIELKGERLDCSMHFEDWNRDFFQNEGLKHLTQIISERAETLTVVHPDSKWCAPVARPGMILCVGLNYSDHAKESNMDIPSEPVLFMKATNTIVGPYDDVAFPKGSTKMDWEVELGIVIGKDALYLESQDQASDHIAGFCVVNDLSERSFQLESTGQWVKGKSCPGFSPIGPYMVTKDEVDTSDLEMNLSVNGIAKQEGSTKTMIFNPSFIVHYVSQFMKLEAGDVISTGTPPGVGFGMNPPEFLQPGDVMELSIEGLGRQRQTIVNVTS